MKELSIEEKAKRFDEAIERARELMSCCKNNRDRRTKIYRIEDIESLFPGVIKSRDEEMREMAIKAVYAPQAQDCIKSWGINPNDVIAWLKKQSKKFSWSKKDEINCQSLQTIVCYSNITADSANRLSNWLKSLKERIRG